MRDCNSVIRPALESTFSDGVSITDDDGDCRVTLPFERYDGDLITLWIKEGDKGYIVTDEGETYGMLYVSNVNLDQEYRKKCVGSIRERFNLEEAKYEVRALANKRNLGSRILDVYQAIQAISFLSYTRRPYPQTDFRNAVGDYLTDEGYQYEPNFKVKGASEQQVVDFHVLNQRVPTYIEAIHAGNNSSLLQSSRNTSRKWMEIKLANGEHNFVSVVDDEGGVYDEEYMKPIIRHSDYVIPWTERSSLTEAIGTP